MRRFLLAAAALALLATPAFAAIAPVGTTGAAGAGLNGPGGTGDVAAMTEACPAGDLLIVAVSAGLAGETMNLPTDGQGNTYHQLGASHSGAAVTDALFWSILTTGLTTSNSVSASWGTNQGAGYDQINVLCFSGIAASAPNDVASAWVSGNTTGPTGGAVSTGTLAQASELLISFDDEEGANNAWTADSAHGFTQSQSVNYGGRLAVDYATTSSTASVPDNPALAGATQNDVAVFSFKGAAAGGGPPITHFLSSAGAGE